MKAIPRRYMRWRPWRAARGLLGAAGLGGGGTLIGGCAAAAGLGAGVATALLAGLFLNRLQASLAATAHSYGYHETGNAWMNFGPPRGGQPTFVGFTGRLPGFHMVIINVNDKATPTAQEDEPVIFETDVTIDLSQVPPALTGTIRERDGTQTFPLEELYPEITDVSVTLREPDARGRYRVIINIKALDTEGEELDYTLTMWTRVSSDGSELTGSLEVDRVLIPPDAEPIVIEGEGEIEGDKQPDDALPEEDNENDNEAEPEANENTEDEGDVEANDNADEEPANDNEDDLENENVADDDTGGDVIITSEACPGVPVAIIAFLNELIADLGFDGLDTNGSGVVTATEVQDAVNPYITPLALTAEAAACIAEVVNG